MARKAAQDAIHKLDEYFAGSSDPRILNLLRAAALTQVGRAEEAKELIDRLMAMGFDATMI